MILDKDKAIKTINNDDFKQMERTNERVLIGMVLSHVESFVVFGKRLRWLKVEKESNSMRLLTLKELHDLAGKKIPDPYLKKLPIDVNLYLNKWNFTSETWLFCSSKIPLFQ